MIFHLNGYWFNKVAIGKKTKEYREKNKYWKPRISKIKKGDLIYFQRGYSGLKIKARVKNIRILSQDKIPYLIYKYFDCDENKNRSFYEIAFELINIEM